MPPLPPPLLGELSPAKLALLLWFLTSGIRGGGCSASRCCPVSGDRSTAAGGGGGAAVDNNRELSASCCCWWAMMVPPPPGRLAALRCGGLLVRHCAVVGLPTADAAWKVVQTLLPLALWQPAEAKGKLLPLPPSAPFRR